MEVDLLSSSGQVQVWFRLQLKCNSLEPDSEEGQLVPILLWIMKLVPQLKISYKSSCRFDAISAVNCKRIWMTVTVVKCYLNKTSDNFMVLIFRSSFCCLNMSHGVDKSPILA